MYTNECTRYVKAWGIPTDEQSDKQCTCMTVGNDSHLGNNFRMSTLKECFMEYQSKILNVYL